ncbi:MAG: hypothetical protein QY331_01775 [Melioribacteraceae bacterium]|nr:MAG: hypothetical protein QY331_01775 [Melioribacteraceae bacterium]
MFKVRIGGVESEPNVIDENGINQQINRQRAEGNNVCVRVSIQSGELEFGLATINCEGIGRGKKLEGKEKEIWDLWVRNKLNSTNFTGGNVVAFLKQLKRILD